MEITLRNLLRELDSLCDFVVSWFDRALDSGVCIGAIPSAFTARSSGSLFGKSLGRSFAKRETKRDRGDKGAEKRTE